MLFKMCLICNVYALLSITVKSVILLFWPFNGFKIIR